MEYIYSFLEYFNFNNFYEENYIIKNSKNINQNISEEEINKIIQEAIADIKYDKEYKELNNRYHKLCQEIKKDQYNNEDNNNDNNENNDNDNNSNNDNEGAIKVKKIKISI